MEFNKINVGIIGAALIVAVIFGGFVYSNKKADAAWEANRQEVIVKIDKQQEAENEAYNSKYNLPVVNESHPARYEAPTDPPPAPTVDSTKSTPNSTPASTSPKAEDTEQPAPQPIPTQTPPTTTTPPPQVKSQIINDSIPAITSLSDADISRLQSYATYGSTGQGFFANFTDFYAHERSNADGFFEKFNPGALSVYNKAKVEWLSTPKLEYRTMIGTIGFRGILTLTYYGDNSFGLTPNVAYQCDVEYQVMNSVETGFALNSIKYLSDFRAVK